MLIVPDDASEARGARTAPYRLLYPRIRLAELPAMLGYAALGTVLAGVYGMVHDQVTYSISHEYFTRMKFLQFDYADFGLPPRVFVAEIGFLATWWVGLFAAWFIARVTVPAFSRATAMLYTLRGFAVVLAAALMAAVVGYLLGVMHGPDYSTWERTAAILRITDLPAFVRVAYIHNASYLGGLIGLIAAVVYVRRRRNDVA